MKTIVVTDSLTNLNETLFEQYELYLISNHHNPIGQIVYSVDKLVSAGFNIIYLTSGVFYESLSKEFSKMSDIHSNHKIILIDIDSNIIGKNNLVLKLLTNSYQDIINKYYLRSATYYDKTSYAILNDIEQTL